MKLPEPSSEAIASSTALRRKVADAITQNGGWISFARYMEMALYEPGLGYYSNDRMMLGRQGDFVTAPEISPLFGQTIAQAIIPFMAQSAFCILEIGAGSGRLAHDILSELAHQDVTLERYDILDLSGDLRQKQRKMLAAFDQVRWLDNLPEAFTGVILGNEVLDAMPVQLVTKENDAWHELGVVLSNAHFAFDKKPAENSLVYQIAQQIPDAEALPEHYITEVHARACAFIRSLVDMQKAGKGSAAIFVDYGYPAREYYLPQRNRGTLLSYYRHRLHSDPFWYPGLQDITSHVDFSAIAGAAIENGMDLLCYASQAAFLMANGIMDRLSRISPEDAARYLPDARKVNMLLSPAEMGELFKVLIFGNLDLPAYLASIDRSERL
ncbi:MAG: SAM-dependent methyltransferase [Betaproteobacteria bacterium]|nr:SAM-dependent methyltransferase [Betaproteobacteria bacterium]